MSSRHAILGSERRALAAPCLLLLCAAACSPHAESDHHAKAHGGDARPAEAGPTEQDHHDEVVLSADAVARYGVTTELARRRHLEPTITTPARVGFDTEAMAHVGSQLRGRIAEVKVRLGDAVRKGQELAIVDSPELGEAQAAYLQSAVAVQTAGRAAARSRVAWERARGLYEQSQGISLTEVQRREVEHQASEAALRAAEAERTAARNLLRLLGMEREAIDRLAETGEVVPRIAIRAAIDGMVVQREVTLGELVSPDREYLMVLADPSRLWVLADVPEAELLGIRVGARAWISVGTPGGAGVERFEGSVAFLSPFVDPTTRTAQVRIEVSTSELGLRPGMFVQAEIVTVNSANRAGVELLAVPEVAVQTVEGRPALFVPVPDEPNTFAKRAVTVGKAIGGLVPVHSGLAEGEAFVAAGSFILKAELGKGAAAHEH